MMQVYPSGTVPFAPSHYSMSTDMMGCYAQQQPCNIQQQPHPQQTVGPIANQPVSIYPSYGYYILSPNPMSTLPQQTVMTNSPPFAYMLPPPCGPHGAYSPPPLQSGMLSSDAGQPPYSLETYTSMPTPAAVTQNQKVFPFYVTEPNSPNLPYTPAPLTPLHLSTTPSLGGAESTSPSDKSRLSAFASPRLSPVSLAPPYRERKNVHMELHDILRYVPHHENSKPLLTEDDPAIRCLKSYPPISVFIQMFPCELKDRVETMNHIIREVSEDEPLGLVDSVQPRSETSFIAKIRTKDIWNLIQRLRCRVLMDRHGFWYAETMEQYVTMKTYCEGIRCMPQQARHTKTDGLPCMPLVVELSTSEAKHAICAPQAPPCFDAIAPIRAVERHRSRK